MSDYSDLESKILTLIQKASPSLRKGSFPEQLDSLHRIFLIEQLEEEYQVSLRELIFERSAWSNFDAFIAFIRQKIDAS